MMPKWIRVRDTQTGHTFDVEAQALKHRRGVEPVNDPDRWPDIEGPRAQPRPAKPHVAKDGKARPATAADTTEPDDDTTTTPGGGQTSSRRRGKPTGPDAPADSSEENQQ